MYRPTFFHGLGLMCLLAAFPDARGEHQFRFRKVDSSGLETFHLSGEPEKPHLLEATSGGVCALDFNNDGWIDLFLVNGGHLEILSGRRPPVASRLFRNTGRGAFQDVTRQAGVSNTGAWGQGCSAADFDQDGWVDLYVTSYGPNRLYRNNGDGTFTDRAAHGPLEDTRWSTGAAWADYDNDGDLDLYVTNYLELSGQHLPVSLRDDGEVGAKFCRYLGQPVFCGPRGLRGAADALYRNEGQGSFVEVTRRAGLLEALPGYGFAAVWSDFDVDGEPDLFVANDSVPNYLYHNRGDGTFEEMGYLSGTAVSEDAREQASMGAAVGDYDRDGLMDLFLSHFSNDSNTLYRNVGNMLFEDMSFASALGEASIP